MRDRADPFSRAEVQKRGFDGFASVRALLESRCADVPRTPGVYVVMGAWPSMPAFVWVGTGGFFKKKDPNVDDAVLQARWVASATLYIGQTATSLRDRLWALVRFGNGQAVGHYGGRYLWQIPDPLALVVAWTEDDEPRVAETKLLTEFNAQFGALPFANISW